MAGDEKDRFSRLRRMSIRSVVKVVVAIAALAGLTIGGLAFFQSSDASPGAHIGIQYCSAGSQKLTLDLYQPSESKPHPVVIYVHGGGWVGGSSSLSGYSADVKQRLNSGGIALASINYRLSKVAPWPAPLQDTQCAIRYLRAHASSLNIDPNKIGIYGDSAGGHIAAMAALEDAAPASANSEWSNESNAVNSVADLFGPADLNASNWSPILVSDFLAEFGAVPGLNSGNLTSASPVDQVHSGAPPFLIVQGEEDLLVPPSQSIELDQQLTKVGVPAKLILVQNANHEFLPIAGKPEVPSQATIDQDIADFFALTLG